ncbi:hypothetical protein E1200_32830, partial [Actinomadura sp. GC306]|uniref:hypothetical protein n=1 Tax=Actinomadura sp. GC306 TaxID=2530367 RepID=UPI0010DF81B2
MDAAPDETAARTPAETADEAPDEAPDEAAAEESVSGDGGKTVAGAGEPFAVRIRVTWRDGWVRV